MMGQVEAFLERKFAHVPHIPPVLLDFFQTYETWGLADPNFYTDVLNGTDGQFKSRVWEMQLAAHLKSLGYEIESSAHGPDFKVTTGSQTYWVEAVCPEPSGIPEEWLMRSLEPGHVYSVPSKEILLRWTSAIRDKSKRIREYIQNGLIHESDVVVLAINGSKLGSPPEFFGISQFPVALEAVLPVGPMQVAINSRSHEVEDSYYKWRPQIRNTRGSNIPTDIFLTSDHDHISAILGSCADLNTIFGHNSEIAVVHNPCSKNVASPRIFKPTYEYWADIKEQGFDLKWHTNTKDFLLMRIL